MKKGLISIIVPVYNVEKYLDRCIESLRTQTYENIEIILVDDGSPDHCPSMCEQYAKQDNRIKVVHKDNAGLGFARNSGLDIATGEYVAFVDSDDYVTPNMCQLLYDAAEKEQADIVYGGIFRDNTAENKITEKPCVKQKTVWRGHEKVSSLLLDFIAQKPEENNDTIMEVSVWKALFKMELFETYNIRFVSERQFISEDVIFDIDFMSKSNCVAAIPECIYYYCVNPDSLSKSFRNDRFKKVIELYHELQGKLYQLYEKDTADCRLYRFLIARARTNSRQIVHHRKIIGAREEMNGLHFIAEHPELRTALKNYPILKLPKKYALVAWLMKHKWYFCLEKILRR